MLDSPPVHLCLLAHCVASSRAPLVHPELFIPLADLDRLLERLAEKKFLFCLPNALPQNAPKTCSFTFDDGYANNWRFLPLAEKYGLPFVLFLSSLNIAEQLPFLWDAASLAGGPRKPLAEDYREAYRHLDEQAARKLLGDDNHRPFKMAELQKFSANKWAHLALHTHCHQPLVGRFVARAAAEVAENASFLVQFPRALVRDLAFPSGLYMPSTARMLLNGPVDRVYTVDGGGTEPDSSVVHRISLLNPQVGGDLLSQIDASFSLRARLRRKVVNFRYSAPMLNRF